MKDAQTEEERRRAIAWAVALTADTPLDSKHYEQELLERYAQGELTFAQLHAQLSNRIQHLLYHSQATRPMLPAELTALVKHSQTWNADHNITGLLCYSSSGHFVQVLEGAAADVHTLFDNIRRDRRHFKVQVLSDRPTPTRWFADWRMAFVGAELHEVYWLLGYLEAKNHNLVRPRLPLLPSHLMTLVEAFSKL